MPHGTQRRGVTFIELLIVVFIIGILSAAISVSMSGTIDDSEDKTLKANLATWKLAASRFQWEKIKNGAFPQSFNAMILGGMIPSDADSTPFQIVPDSGIIRVKP